MTSSARFRALHYYSKEGKPLCKHPTAKRLTAHEAMVTCVNCKRILGRYHAERFNS